LEHLWTLCMCSFLLSLSLSHCTLLLHSWLCCSLSLRTPPLPLSLSLTCVRTILVWACVSVWLLVFL
jgi:hypothetical protein